MLSFDIHEDICPRVQIRVTRDGVASGGENIEEFTDKVSYSVDILEYTSLLESLIYPSYGLREGEPAQVQPHVVYVSLGKAMKFSGIAEAIDKRWSGPIRDGKYIRCNINIRFKEVMLYSVDATGVRKGQRGHVEPGR